MSEIIPAILAQDTLDLSNKISEVPEVISFAHIDVLGEDVWTETKIEFEAHLMVENPKEVFELWKSRGAKRIIVHKYDESMQGVELGLALEMHVPIERALPYMGKIDFIQLMSIAEIGEQGHHLDERIFDRIREVKDKFPGMLVSVDGGVKLSNYKKLEEAGADRLIVGSGFKELWQSLMKE